MSRRTRAAVAHGAIAGAVAAIAASVGVWLFADDNRDRERLQLETTADYVRVSLQEGLDDAGRRLSAHAAFFEASENVTIDGFERFASTVEGGDGVWGWTLVEVVADADLEAFVNEARVETPSFEVEPVGSVPVDPHYIVRYWYSEVEGFDPVGRDVATTRIAPAIEEAVRTGRATSSEIVSLPPIDELGLVLVHPVDATPSDEVTRIVTAPITLQALIETQLPGPLVPRVAFDGATRSDSLNPERVVRELEVGSTVISVAVDPMPSRLVAEPGPWVLATGVVSGIAVGIFGFTVSRRRDLQRRLQASKHANEVRDHLLGVMAHGIRTPLTAVVGFASEVHEAWEELSDGERAEMITIISEQAREVAATVADLLVVGTSDLASLYLMRDRVEIGPVLEEIVAGLPSEDRERLWVDGDLPAAMGDRGRLTQAIRDLVVYGLRTDDGDVRVRGGLSGEAAWLQVQADGLRLPDRDVLASQVRGYAVLPEPGAPLESSGLGVVVARRLAEAMGGQLTSFPCHGVPTIELTLPAARAPHSTPSDRSLGLHAPLEAVES